MNRYGLNLLTGVLLVSGLPAQQSDPQSFTPADQKLATAAAERHREAMQLYRQGRPADALVKAKEAWDILQKLYPVSKYPDGHPNLANCLNTQGAMLKMMGQSPKALPYFEQALAMTQKLYPAAKHPDGHPDVALSLNNLGTLLDEVGQPAKALTYFEQSLAMLQKLYPTSKYPNGHRELALSLNNLGDMLRSMGQSAKALPYAEQALAMQQRLYPASKYFDGHPDLADSLNNLGSLHRALGQLPKALPYYEQSLEMCQKLYPVAKYPDGHPSLAGRLNGLGSALEAMGQTARALPNLEQALAMRQKFYPAAKFPDGHPEIANSLNTLGSHYDAKGQFPESLQYYEQSLAMRQRLFPVSKYPNGHPDLARSLNNMGYLLNFTGQSAKALPYYEQGLAMRQMLFPAAKFPSGHPEIAASIQNLGAAYQALGQETKALTNYEQALAMSEKLYPATQYPDGHPELAAILHNLGALHRSMGQLANALSCLERALTMQEKLYSASKLPDGHPGLAHTLNNLGLAHYRMGQCPKALGYYEQALAMRQKLYPPARYPDGHFELATSLNNLGFLHDAMDLPAQALPYFERALTMYQLLGQQMLETASEAELLAYVRTRPITRDGFLSLTTKLPDTDAKSYAAVWSTKAAVTRVLAQRHAATRIAGAEHAAKLDRFRDVRRSIDYLLRDNTLSKDDRDKFLTKATDERDTLEREIAMAIPTQARAKALGQLGPDALGPLLPEFAILIDIVRYTKFEYEPAKPGHNGESRTESYAAFVVAKKPVSNAFGTRIVRVELGDAKPIDRDVAAWRTAIDTRSASRAADGLRERVWAKLAPHIPKGTQTLYLAPDGDLARMPWAALPVAENRVLLEEYALATVPHGPFMLESIKYRAKYRDSDSTLLLGGIDFNSKTWPNLPGAATEIAALRPLAPKPIEITKGDATPKRLTELLGQVRYGHLATHGYFDAVSLVAEDDRARQAMESRQTGEDTRRVAAQNPLGFVGFVLSNGEVFTGLNLVDQPLENLRLVTLSACETGLGELTGGEGVQGLQRAFHLAGCPNVVASLWKVNDAATAALMAKFYHEMWVNKKPPIEALRQAQLTIYYHPESIPVLAKADRGAPDFKKAIAVEGKPTAAGKRTDTKLWAAFVLSGVGK